MKRKIYNNFCRFSLRLKHQMMALMMMMIQALVKDFVKRKAYFKLIKIKLMMMTVVMILMVTKSIKNYKLLKEYCLEEIISVPTIYLKIKLIKKICLKKDTKKNKFCHRYLVAQGDPAKGTFLDAIDADDVELYEYFNLSRVYNVNLYYT